MGQASQLGGWAVASWAGGRWRGAMQEWKMAPRRLAQGPRRDTDDQAVPRRDRLWDL
jgi:hypothetical protein